MGRLRGFGSTGATQFFCELLTPYLELNSCPPCLSNIKAYALKPRPSNPRTHSEKQIAQIASAIQRFGFTNPIIVDTNNIIAAGVGRFRAAQRLGLAECPTIRD